MGLTLHAQTPYYNLSVLSEDYSDLIGSTSLNNDLTWNDPLFTIPIGFDFQYFGDTINELFFDEIGSGGILGCNTGNAAIISLLVPYGAAIIDRGYNFDTGISESSLSNISYLLEGMAGSRILKVEWKNVGFYSELEDDNVSTDYTNFQLWLYEGTNDIEMHYGPNSITRPDLCYENGKGTFVALINGYNLDTDSIFQAIVLEENPEMPSISIFTTGDTLPSYFDNPIPNGTIYRFTHTPTGVSRIAMEPAIISLYPNPSNDIIHISSDELKMRIIGISIYNANGQRIKEVTFSNNTIDISEFIPGTYFIQIRTTTDIIVKRLIKS